MSVRAGGEALELFIEEHYNLMLASQRIKVKWLNKPELRKQYLNEMKISEHVGQSKLDMVLIHIADSEEIAFGGIHVKASLAERVSDDVPCSRALMEKGLTSILYTLDAKSFPQGDLINRGELGSPSNPTDKRSYIENHGEFSACVSYNLRTLPSDGATPSGREILVTNLGDNDALIKLIISERDRIISAI